MQTKHWRLADNDMDVADALLDRGVEQFVDEDGCHRDSPRCENDRFLSQWATLERMTRTPAIEVTPGTT